MRIPPAGHQAHHSIRTPESFTPLYQDTKIQDNFYPDMHKEPLYQDTLLLGQDTNNTSTIQPQPLLISSLFRTPHNCSYMDTLHPSIRTLNTPSFRTPSISISGQPTPHLVVEVLHEPERASLLGLIRPQVLHPLHTPHQLPKPLPAL